MRTTLDLPESLLEKLMRLSGEKNKTRLITNALIEYDRKLRREKLLSCQGKGIISEDFSPYKIRNAEKDESNG
jgi:hypothetical protein